MADYSYAGRGNTTSGKGRFGARFQKWDTAYDGAKNDADVWSNPNSGSDGRAVPRVVAGPPQHQQQNGNIYTIQTVVEQTHASQLMSPPRHGSPSKGQDSWDYKVGNNRWSQTGGMYQEEPPKVKEFIDAVQNEASGGRRMGFPKGLFQRQTANQSSFGDHGNSNTISTSGWSWPTQERNGHVTDVMQEPTMITTSRWGQTSQTGWPTPNSYGTPLSRPTNDINSAAEFLRESVRPLPVSVARTEPWSTPKMPAKDTTSGTKGTKVIDSREAAKKYNGQFI